MGMLLTRIVALGIYDERPAVVGMQSLALQLNWADTHADIHVLTRALEIWNSVHSGCGQGQEGVCEPLFRGLTGQRAFQVGETAYLKILLTQHGGLGMSEGAWGS